MSKQKAQSAASGPSATQSPKSTAWLWGMLGVLVVIVVAVLMLQRAGTANKAAASLPAEISVAEAAAKRDAGAFILDVREPSEWAESHIPGATLIPLGDLAARVNEVPRDKEVVVVCRSGNRSRTGRDLLAQAGYINVTSMTGGMKDWTAAKLPTVTGP